MTTPPPSIFHALLAAALLAPAGSASAALAITNGTFGTDNANGAYIDGAATGLQNDPAWFERSAANWSEGSWPGNGGGGIFTSGQVLLFDGGDGNLGWIYQSLGTVSLSEIADGTLRISADFLKKGDGTTNAARFDVFAGNFTGVDGSDILGAGLTSLGTFTLTAAQQGLSTQTAGTFTRSNNVLVGEFDISGLVENDQVWLRIAESRLTTFTTGDLMIDNLATTVIPEPSAALLGGLGILALLRRRR